MLTEVKQELRGATHPRLNTPWLNTKSRIDEIVELANSIGQPLLDWQRLILTDMCAVDEENMFIKKSALFVCARQSGKSHMMRMRVLAGLFCFGERNILIMSSQRQMASKSLEIMAGIIERTPHLLAQVKGGNIDKAYKRTNGNERIILESMAHAIKEKVVEIKIHIPKQDCFVKASANTFQTAFDEAFNSITNQLIKKKERLAL